MQLFGHSKTKYEMKITKESQIVRFCETLCLLFGYCHTVGDFAAEAVDEIRLVTSDEMRFLRTKIILHFLHRSTRRRERRRLWTNLSKLQHSCAFSDFLISIRVALVTTFLSECHRLVH